VFASCSWDIRAIVPFANLWDSQHELGMGLSGDALQVFLFFVALAAGAALTALTVDGWKRRAALASMVLCVVLAVAVNVAPAGLPLGASLPVLYGLMPGLVALAVWLPLRGRPPALSADQVKAIVADEIVKYAPAPAVAEVIQKAAPTPEERLRASAVSHWTPDTTMAELVIYLGNNGMTGPPRTRIAVIHQALWQGRLTAWARIRPDPEAEEIQTGTSHWNQADLDRDDGYVFFRELKMAAFGLRFSRGEIEATWPPRR